MSLIIKKLLYVTFVLSIDPPVDVQYESEAEGYTREIASHEHVYGVKIFGVCWRGINH